MTPEDRILCLCTRQNLGVSHLQQLVTFCHRHQVRWRTVYDIAVQNDVAPIVHLNLSRHQDAIPGVPDEVQNQFKKAYIHNVFVKKGTAAILEKILALFARKGMDVLLLKGAALNILVYEQPWYTVSGDVDLVIRERREEIPSADLRDIVDFIEGWNHQQTVYKEHFEYDFYAHHDMTMNGLLPIDMERIWSRARKIQFGDGEVFVMAPEDMLIAAAINSCRKRFFKLKPLFDMAAIMRKYPDMDWEMLTDMAQAWRCNVIAYTALLVTKMTLGCPLPAGVLADLAVNPVRELMVNRLVRLLYQRGSFSNLSIRQENTSVWSRFSWGLPLTYASYRLDQIGTKLGQVYGVWRERPRLMT